MSPQSCTHSMRVTFVTPVSMSTSTSANCTPLVPLAESPASHSPSTDTGSVPSRRHAAFQSRPLEGSAFDEMRPSGRPGRPAEHRAGRDPCGQGIERLARRDANRRGDGCGGRAAATAAAERMQTVADLRLDGRIGQAQRFGRYHGDDRSCAGADVLRAAAHDHAAIRQDLDVCLRAAPAPPQRLAAQPIPRLTGPAVGSPVRCRLLHPNFSAAIGKCRHIALGASGGRFFIRNATGSIRTLSASSSISSSVA